MLATGLDRHHRIVHGKKNVECFDMIRACLPDNAPCFAACPGGASNTTSPCYLTCYAEAVNGNPDKGVKQMPKEQITDPWVTAQKEDDPAKGGCPTLHPTHTI